MVFEIGVKRYKKTSHVEKISTIENLREQHICSSSHTFGI